MKSILITIGLSIAVLGIIVLVTGSQQSQEGASGEYTGDSVLTASTSHFDFGTISMKDGDVSTIFELRNNTDEPITIGKVFTSCMCTSAALSIAGERFGPYGMQGHGFIPKVGRELVPGETAELIVTFDPNAHGPAGVGTIQRNVTVEQDDHAPFEVSFTANVKP